jgi:host factor-I protein
MTPGPPERPQPGIQDAFLIRVRRDALVVSIFLVNGTKLTGRIKQFDKYSLLVESDGQEQLLFKHAVASVVIAKAPGGGPGTKKE